jgi:hypothetical protein
VSVKPDVRFAPESGHQNWPAATELRSSITGGMRTTATPPTYTRPGPGAGMGGATRKGDGLDSFDSRSYLAVMSLRERTRWRGGIEPCLHSFALLHEKSRLA